MPKPITAAIVIFSSLTLAACSAEFPWVGSKKMTVGDTTIAVEIADTPAKRTQGLSGRDNLSADQGMLFLFESKDYWEFWMKQMKFPIDIIWISGDTVAGVTENIPPPTQGVPLTIYRPPEPVDKVLEVRAGFVYLNHISLGTHVELPQ